MGRKRGKGLARLDKIQSSQKGLRKSRFGLDKFQPSIVESASFRTPRTPRTPVTYSHLPPPTTPPPLTLPHGIPHRVMRTEYVLYACATNGFPFFRNLYKDVSGVMTLRKKEGKMKSKCQAPMIVSASIMGQPKRFGRPLFLLTDERSERT